MNVVFIYSIFFLYPLIICAGTLPVSKLFISGFIIYVLVTFFSAQCFVCEIHPF